ncbi:MAG: hypothetical protein JWO38_7189 [Gemmataceae bacterium]|nr:hypothetical protein [Gemmataceae bacterium]
MFQLHRTRRFADGKVEQEVVYGITSLDPAEANAARLLDLNRSHWSIENNFHRARDVQFGEDAGQVRSGDGPQILAATRNALNHLVAAHNIPSLVAAMRRFVIRPLEALGLLKAIPEN